MDRGGFLCHLTILRGLSVLGILAILIPLLSQTVKSSSSLTYLFSDSK